MDVDITGQDIHNASMGVQMLICDRISVSDCTILDNSLDGVYLIITDGSHIYDNTIRGNGRYGVQLD